MALKNISDLPDATTLVNADFFEVVQGVGNANGKLTATLLRAFAVAGLTITESQVTNLVADLAAKVPTTTTVNGHALNANVTVTASDVGLGNVTNTSDVNKPVSTAQQTALNLKANIASPTFTGTVGGITATMVGLGSVENAAASGLYATITRQVIAGTGLTGGGSLAADRTFTVAYGTTSTTSCVGNDSRLGDSRPPSGSAGGDLAGTYPNPTLGSQAIAQIRAIASLRV